MRRDQGSWWWPRVVAVVFFALLSGYLVVQGINCLPDSEDIKAVTCDDKVMHPGDQCHVVSRSGSSVSTYEEMRDGLEQGSPVLMFILFGLSVVSLGAAGWHARKIWGARPVRTGPGLREQRAGNRESRRLSREANARLRTTTAIVGGVNPSLEWPSELVLGRYSARSGKLSVVGVVRIDDPDEADGLFSTAGDEHPWRPTRAGAGQSARLDRRFRVDCTAVVPEIVAEIRVDPESVSERGRWQHVEFVHFRHDLAPADVPAGHQLTSTDSVRD